MNRILVKNRNFRQKFSKVIILLESEFWMKVKIVIKVELLYKYRNILFKELKVDERSLFDIR